MKRRRIKKVVEAVFNSVWAITPEKLEEIASVVSRRDAGQLISRDQLAEFDMDHPDLLELRSFGGPVSGEPHTVASKIAVLNLYGTISQRMNLVQEFSGGTSTEEFSRVFDAMVRDQEVSAIVINTDSPGGRVPGVEELAAKIFAARGTKPIVAMVNAQMCSAAYWIASAADEIVSTPSAVSIGSIGCMFIHEDVTEKDKEEGHSYLFFRSHDSKALGSPHEPVSEDFIKQKQSLVDQIGQRFVQVVAQHRGVSVSDVESKFGQGGTFTAQEALAVGMIDRIATLEQVLAELGVGGTSDSGTAIQSRSATTTTRIQDMDPKIRLAMIKAGLISATAEDATAEKLLALVCDAHGVKAEDVDAVVAAIGGQQTAKLQSATATLKTVEQNPGLSVQDICGLITTAGASLSADEKLSLQTALVASAGSLTLNQVLDKISEKTTAANPPVGASPDRVQVTQDSRDKFMMTARDSILTRHFEQTGRSPEQVFDLQTGGMREFKPAVSQDYSLRSLPKLAARCLVECGVPYQKAMQLNEQQIARLVMGADPYQIGMGNLGLAADGPAYNVSGMFNNLLLDAANVVLRQSYMDGRSTYQQWCRRGESVRDFKWVNKVIGGELGDPGAIPEDGEFDEVTMSDGKERYKLAVWGEIVSLSWQLIVNDRLAAFTEVPDKMGRAMRRKQNRLVYSIIKDNQKLSDNVALFHTTHKNKTTGSISDYGAAFATMEKKMAEQKGLDDDSGALNTVPRFILLPPVLNNPIGQAIGSASDPSGTHSGVKNTYYNRYQPIMDAELGATFGGSDTRFILAADPAEIDTIEYAYLEGMESPVIEQQTAFDRLAIRQRIYQPFATAAIDYRGLQEHTGA